MTTTQISWKNYEREGRLQEACYFCGNKNNTQFTWATQIFFCKKGQGCSTKH